MIFVEASHLHTSCVTSTHLECVHYLLLLRGFDIASIRVGVDVAMMGAGGSQQKKSQSPTHFNRTTTPPPEFEG